MHAKCHTIISVVMHNDTLKNPHHNPTIGGSLYNRSPIIMEGLRELINMPVGNLMKDWLQFEKGLNQDRIKMSAVTGKHDLHGLGVGFSRFIDTFGDEGVIDIGNGHDTASQRYLIALEPVSYTHLTLPTNREV